ncbi:DUF6284 family protein [Streptomyces sp. NPDC056149]|uniref:DUF6284 family protein n=1 Tax=Streptomyces sp. NPDC056149 TaxID=3345728 RepID=UPI0035D83B38
MDQITVAGALTAFEPWLEPTDAELAALQPEMDDLLEGENDEPFLRAVSNLLDAQLITRYRPATELDVRRIRRARRRVLAAGRDLANRTAATLPPGGAA